MARKGCGGPQPRDLAGGDPPHGGDSRQMLKAWAGMGGGERGGGGRGELARGERREESVKAKGGGQHGGFVIATQHRFCQRRQKCSHIPAPAARSHWKPLNFEPPTPALANTAAGAGKNGAPVAPAVLSARSLSWTTAASGGRVPTAMVRRVKNWVRFQYIHERADTQVRQRPSARPPTSPFDPSDPVDWNLRPPSLLTAAVYCWSSTIH